MRMPFSTFLAFSIPTLWIYYAFVADRLGPVPWYRESFGDDSTYVDIYFESNPYGIFLGDQPVSFNGFWIDENRSYEINGYRVRQKGKVLYQFKGANRPIVGELIAPNPPGCEPRLRLRNPNSNAQTLNAAFCLEPST